MTAKTVIICPTTISLAASLTLMKMFYLAMLPAAEHM
jgi:hypothetical protein